MLVHSSCLYVHALYKLNLVPAHWLADCSPVACVALMAGAVRVDSMQVLFSMTRPTIS